MKRMDSHSTHFFSLGVVFWTKDTIGDTTKGIAK